MSSARQGFFWWEIDLTYYALKLLSWTGLIWDLKQPPAHVRAGQRGISQEIRERVAQALAASFPADGMAAQMQARYSAAGHSFDELRARAEEALSQGRDALANLRWPELPSMDELHRRARQRFAGSPAMDEIVQSARAHVAEAVARHLLSEARPA